MTPDERTWRFVLWFSGFLLVLVALAVFVVYKTFA